MTEKVTEQKKEYTTPTLTTHGGVDTLTQGVIGGDCSGYTPRPS